MTRTQSGITCAAVLLVGSGCGMFKSSTSQASWESSSRSSSSISSSSSGDEEETTAYQRDVRHFTARYAVGGGAVDVFERELGAIAEFHGVTNWEAERGTYVAMGGGLAEAGLDRAEAEQMARRFARSDADRAEWVLVGYETRTSH